MAQTVEYKTHRQLVNGLADSRLSPAVLAYLMTQEDSQIQDGFMAAFISYVQSVTIQSYYYTSPLQQLDDGLVEICRAIYNDVFVPMGFASPIVKETNSAELGI